MLLSPYISSRKARVCVEYLIGRFGAASYRTVRARFFGQRCAVRSRSEMEALPRHRMRNLVFRVLAGAVAVGVLTLVLWWTGEGSRMSDLFSDHEHLQRVLNRSGALGPLVYVGLVVLQAVVAPLPAPVLAVAGGYCFGPFEGFLLTWLGALLGGVGCFGISRVFGRQFVRGNRRAERFDSYMEAHGAVLVFVLRLIPLVSFDAISYGAGLSGIRFRSFLLATALVWLQVLSCLSIWVELHQVGASRPFYLA